MLFTNTVEISNFGCNLRRKHLRYALSQVKEAEFRSSVNQLRFGKKNQPTTKVLPPSIQLNIVCKIKGHLKHDIKLSRKKQEGKRDFIPARKLKIVNCGAAKLSAKFKKDMN